MSSAKTERLVNLTMALLGSKRYMTKSEIFRRVAGYSGSNETKERMFERDKDDLRGLGIEIEVASHDPLFEDEVGYRIRAEVFQIVESFDSEELGLVSLALNLIRDSELSTDINSLNRRINSLTVSPTRPDEFRIPQQNILEQGLPELLEALSARRTIAFDYRKDGSTESETRKVNPLGLSAWRGNWYLVGEDLNREDVRVFKLSRIASGLEIQSDPGAYAIPDDFDVKDYLVMLQPGEYLATIQVRRSAGLNLRNVALEVKEIDEEWEEIRVGFRDFDDALRETLWLGPDAIVLQPADLRAAAISGLEKLVSNHG